MKHQDFEKDFLKFINIFNEMEKSNEKFESEK